MAPSAASWSLLSKKKWLLEFEGILYMKSHVDNGTSNLCTTVALEQNEHVCKYSLPNSEGYSTLLCGNVITHIVHELNCDKKNVLYMFDVFPVIQKEVDARYNKLADYSIYKIFNKRTYIIVGVKLSVPHRLTSSEKDNLSQLFLEAMYCSSNETVSQIMMCILTNGTVWHMIETDMAKKPIQFIKYHFVGSCHVAQICDTITGFIHHHSE